jgi:hypothetical protein
MPGPATSQRPRAGASSPPPRARRRWALPAAALGAVAVALLAYAVGRWSAEPAAPSAPAEALAAADAPPAPAPAPASIPPGSRAPRPAVPQPAAAPPPAASPSAEAVVERATAEVKAQLELRRPELSARCWASSGPESTRASATVTFNVAFDAQGREVMRGVSEDRRARAPALAKCLRETEDRLAIAPPGSGVTVAVPLTFP